MATEKLYPQLARTSKSQPKNDVEHPVLRTVFPGSSSKLDILTLLLGTSKLCTKTVQVIENSSRSHVNHA